MSFIHVKHNGILADIMEAGELGDAILDALVHLYETQYLQTRPLAGELAGDVPIGSRGHALHRRLRLAIEQLRPPSDAPQHALAWRHSRYLTLRYVHAMTLQQVAAELGITERHCRRVHKEALAALTHLLFGKDGRSEPGVADAEPAKDRQLLESELSRVGAASELPASLRDTVLGVVETLGPLARSARITLDAAIETTGDAGVDRLLIRQVLLNLVVHAIHSQPGARIALIARGDPPPLSLGISVLPLTGTASLGVSPDDEHLAIARHLVGMRGGTLSVQRTSAELRFEITFPTLRPRTVLSIDDNPDFLRLFRRYLESSAYRVIEARSAEEALRLAQADQPNVITLDVLLPHQDGWEILQLLKNHRLTRQIPVIVCSVLRDHDLALSLGASDFLAKPVNRSALLAALDRCCGLNAHNAASNPESNPEMEDE